MAAAKPRSAVSDGAGSRRRWRSAAAPAARSQSVLVSEFQHARIVKAAAAVAFAHGYEAMSATAIIARAGVSRKTFYDLFDSRDDCLLAALDESLSQLADVVAPAYAGADAWPERIRAALEALLAFLEREPESGTLLLAYMNGQGSSDLELRARVLELLHGVLAEGRSQPRARRPLPPLTEEATIGGVLVVLHARMRTDAHALGAHANQLMWMLVLPYLGPAAAGRQLTRATAKPAPAAPAPAVAQPAPASDPLSTLNMRLTYRTARTLEVIAVMPAASNAELSAHVGITDQGQISKLLARLARLGLIENTGAGQPHGAANAWHLTPRGTELELAIRRRSDGAR